MKTMKNALMVHVGNVAILSWMLASVAAVHGIQAYGQTKVAVSASPGWGTNLRPFAADSPWNSRPVAPVFADFVIPKSDYYPLVGEGKYSIGVFASAQGDGPVTVTGSAGSRGLWNPDTEAFHDITIPRWPAGVVPAAGSDGHADIVDAFSGIVHSFYKLRFLDGKWVAAQYAWTRIDGRGWGDPAHYFQGARAAGVASMGGLIRKHEMNDDQPIYLHALALSLTFNALSPDPAYIFPATSADWDAQKANSGKIPEGALLMLPTSFDTQRIADPALRKVADTLKVYGAYVVDRNFGTPFYIYVEIGTGFNLHRNGWSTSAAADLDRIRQELRQVVSTGGWVDGNGRTFVPEKNLNLLSMRGPWQIQTGSTAGLFDSWAQAVIFPKTSSPIVQVNTTSRNVNALSWAGPKSGKSYRLKAIATGGAKLRFVLRDKITKRGLVDSGEMENGKTTVFVWPQQSASLEVQAISGVGQPSTVQGELLQSEQ